MQVYPKSHVNQLGPARPLPLGSWIQHPHAGRHKNVDQVIQAPPDPTTLGLMNLAPIMQVGPVAWARKSRLLLTAPNSWVSQN